MALPSNIVGQNNPTLPVDQGILEVSTTQRTKLGTRLQVGERVFYYAQASASVGGGNVLSTIPSVASHQSGLFAIASASAGSRTISGTSSANVAANLYAEGYFSVSTGANQGHLYKIQGHNSGSAGMTFTLYDPIIASYGTGVGYALTPCPFKVNIGSSALSTPIGVAPVDVTSGGYFWLQTWGICNVLHTAASAAAVALKLGTGGTALAMYPAATDGPGVVGWAIAKNINLAATAAECDPVWLTCIP